jgi:hypothetical protein
MYRTRTLRTSRALITSHTSHTSVPPTTRVQVLSNWNRPNMNVGRMWVMSSYLHLRGNCIVHAVIWGLKSNLTHDKWDHFAPAKRFHTPRAPGFRLDLLAVWAFYFTDPTLLATARLLVPRWAAKVRHKTAIRTRSTIYDRSPRPLIRSREGSNSECSRSMEEYFMPGLKFIATMVPEI